MTIISEIGKFIKNEKGYFSPLTLALIFFLMVSVTGAINIFMNAGLVQESLQKTADTAATAALTQAVKETDYRERVISVDEDIIKTDFTELVRAMYHMDGDYPYLYGGGTLYDIKIEEFDVSVHTGTDKKNWGFADGVKRNMIILDTILVGKVKVNRIFDTKESYSIDYYEYGTNKKRTFTVNGTAGDGYLEIPIHCVAKQVIR